MRILIQTLCVLCVTSAQAQRYRFEIVQYPGAWNTSPTDINNHGHIVGIVQGLGKTMGFLKVGTNFQLIDVPGSGPLNGSFATGINDAGDIVGTFTTEGTNFQSYGYLIRNGVLTPVDYPNSSATQLGGINNLGQIAGRYFPGPFLIMARGFLKEGNNFSNFSFPGAQNPAGTSPYDINDLGQIVGEVLTTNNFQGFLYQSNSFTLITLPNGSRVDLEAINNSGQLAGTFRDFNGGHGFVTVSNRWYQVDVPGVPATTIGATALGINDVGQVVGNVYVGGAVFQLGYVATPCSDALPDCVTLIEIGRPQGPPVIDCPPDIVLDCVPEEIFPVSFEVTATSESGLPPTVVCSPPSGNSFPVGVTTVSCTATDNRGSQAHCEFRVVRSSLQFSGFLPPLGGVDGDGGSFVSPLRTVKMGSTVPVKFVASCGGVPIREGISRLEVTRYLGEDSAEASAPAKGRGGDGNVFRYVDGQWQLSMDTRGMRPGKWLLEVTLPDGSVHAGWIAVR